MTSSPLSFVTRLGRELAGLLQLDDAVTQVAKTLHEALEPDALLIVLNDAETHAPFTAYTAGSGNPRPGDAAVKFVISGGPRVLSDVDDAGREEVGLHDQTVLSWVAAPVLSGGRPIGAVLASSRAAGRYTAEDRDLLQAIATQLGMAVENARLLRLLSLGKLEWEQTVDAIGQAFCLVDARGRVRRANKAFARIVELPVTGLASQAWREILPPGWIKPVEGAIAARNPRATHELERGEQRYTMVAMELVQPPHTSLLIFEDQTENRRLQQQLIQSEKLSAIGQLIAGVAHDLRNPLATVVAIADFLAEEPGTPAAHQTQLATIRSEAERAATLVRNLLTFGRKTGGPRTRRAVAPIVRDTLQLMRHEFTAAGIELAVHLPDENVEIEVHTDRLQQVLVNVLQNALQALRKSRGGTVTVEVSAPDDLVDITVADNGPGVPADVATRVFDAFFTTKSEGEGTGLGLSICQGIIREYGGTIVLESPRSGGAVFRIRLPLATPPPAAPA